MGSSSKTIWHFFLVKTLRRLKLLKYFNFQLSISINRKRIKIPFIYGIGVHNLFLEYDWLNSLIKEFSKQKDCAFIDIGANIGQTVIKLKTLCPEIRYIGFEPNTSCYFYLQQLLKSNSFQDCIIYNCALFNNVSIQKLEKTSIDDPRASIIASSRPGVFLNNENVIAIDYDSYFADVSVSFVKIDVEFSELEVIKGMMKSIIRYHPVIVCEVLDSHNDSTFEFTQSRANELSNLLRLLKYNIIRLGTNSMNHKIISFEIIDNIRIKQWTTVSLSFNDYIFYPSSSEEEVLSILSKVSE